MRLKYSQCTCFFRAMFVQPFNDLSNGRFVTSISFVGWQYVCVHVCVCVCACV